MLVVGLPLFWEAICWREKYPQHPDWQPLSSNCCCSWLRRFLISSVSRCAEAVASWKAQLHCTVINHVHWKPVNSRATWDFLAAARAISTASWPSLVMSWLLSSCAPARHWQTHPATATNDICSGFIRWAHELRSSSAACFQRSWLLFLHWGRLRALSQRLGSKMCDDTTGQCFFEGIAAAWFACFFKSFDGSLVLGKVQKVLKVSWLTPPFLVPFAAEAQPFPTNPSAFPWRNLAPSRPGLAEACPATTLDYGTECHIMDDVPLPFPRLDGQKKRQFEIKIGWVKTVKVYVNLTADLITLCLWQGPWRPWKPNLSHPEDNFVFSTPELRVQPALSTNKQAMFQCGKDVPMPARFVSEELHGLLSRKHKWNESQREGTYFWMTSTQAHFIETLKSCRFNLSSRKVSRTMLLQSSPWHLPSGIENHLVIPSSSASFDLTRIGVTLAIHVDVGLTRI